MNDAKEGPQVNNITNENKPTQKYYIENNVMEYPEE